MKPTRTADDSARTSRPNTASPGNAGARGSRGQANSGAQPAHSTQQGGNERADSEGTPRLRHEDARGAGGAGSNSRRST